VEVSSQTVTLTEEDAKVLNDIFDILVQKGFERPTLDAWIENPNFEITKNRTTGRDALLQLCLSEIENEELLLELFKMASKHPKFDPNAYYCVLNKCHTPSTLISDAIYHSHFEIAELLLDNTSIDVNWGSLPPLPMAILNCRSFDAEQIFHKPNLKKKNIKLIHSLLRHPKIDIMHVYDNVRKLTVLHDAIYLDLRDSDNFEVFETLLKKKPNLNVNSKARLVKVGTPLHMAMTTSPCPEITIPLLIQYHADPNIKNLFGETPLVSLLISDKDEAQKIAATKDLLLAAGEAGVAVDIPSAGDKGITSEMLAIIEKAKVEIIEDFKTAE
jgi:hypothetical protein